MSLLPLLGKMAVVGYYLYTAYLIGLIVLENRNPIKTIGYIMLLSFVPVIGVFIYFMVGQNYRKKKLFNRKEIENEAYLRTWHNRLSFRNALLKEHKDGLGELVKVAKLLMRSDKAVLSTENSIDFYFHGKVLLPDLLKSFKSAQNHIHIECYIIEDGVVWSSIEKVLLDKLKAGISVRIIYDDFGSSLSSKSIRTLAKAGGQIVPFTPVRFPLLSNKINYRDHRKLIVIDGTTGFLGGMNLADRYMGEGKMNWRDTHLKIQGVAVKSLQLLFLLNWRFASENPVEPDEQLITDVEIKNTIPIQIAGSGPDSDWASIMQAFFTAITEAKEEVLITTPYFIPNESIYTAILIAAQSGVTIEVIIPENSDSFLARYATDSYIAELMEAGVIFHKYTNGFIHAKTMVVDGSFCTVGTANMDYRSFNTNFEVNAFIYDREAAQELKNAFLLDTENSELIDQEAWSRRGLARRLKESFARLFAPML